MVMVTGMATEMEMDIIKTESAYFCCPKCGDEVFVTHFNYNDEYICKNCDKIWICSNKLTKIESRNEIYRQFYIR
jgi:DNA replicative helicase MCM subunit Mcm2 (Cdc46/Mcm family)